MSDQPTPDQPEADEAGAEEPDPYRRRVAVVLALLGVLGAWIGILRIDSANNEATLARETTRTAVQSLQANVTEAAVAGLEVDLDAEAAALADELPFADPAGVDPGTAVEGDLARSSDLAGQDREALARDLAYEASRLDLGRRALAETRVTYNNRTSQYETVLTTLAVALFLVGFSLVLERRTRPPVLVPGLLIAAYVAGWAVHIHQKPVPRTDPAAIEATAEGNVHRLFGEFDAATAAYTEAIDLDGDFAAPRTGRSTSSFLTANPDWGETLAVVRTDGPAVDQARRDAAEAIRLGNGRDAAPLVVSALLHFYDGDHETAADLLGEAAGIDPRAPEIPLVATAVELARGDDAAAEAQLDRLLDLLDLDESSLRNRAYAANLFTLLEQVADLAPEQAEAAEAFGRRLAAGETELVVGEALPRRLPAAGTVTVDDVALRGDTVEVTVTATDLPEDTALTVYVNEQPVEGAPFAQAPELARFVRFGGSRTVTGDAEVPRACRPVNLRIDVYLDGAFYDSFPADGGPPTC